MKKRVCLLSCLCMLSMAFIIGCGGDNGMTPEEIGKDPEGHEYLIIEPVRRLIIRASEVGIIKTLTEKGGLEPRSVLEWAEKNAI